MRESEGRYQAYLEQLQTLEEFRQIHGERHPTAPIDSEDPAVIRIIEALAYFTVGTNAAAQSTMRSSLERLLSGYFDFLLSPMPALATVQLCKTERLIDSTTLSEGSGLSLTASDGTAALFRTMHDLPILNGQLDGVDVLVLEDGFRLLLKLRTQLPVGGLAQTLPLRVHHLDRYVASLRVLHHLRRHLRGVSAFFDSVPTDGRAGAPCEIAFGAVLGSATVCNNPLERVRLLLHYPELELSAQLAIPAAPRPWTRLTVAFDLDSKWPDARAAASNPFVLHAVPVINLKRAAAAIVRHDGTRPVHPLLPNENDRHLELASIVGVYECGDKQSGRVPIPASGLPGTSEGYEIERVQTAAGLKHRIVLRLPNAFTNPRRVAVEAEWHQPSFSASAAGALRAALSDRYIEGVQIKLLGALRPAQESPLAQLSSALLELLAMRMKPTLRRDELVALLRLLGVDEGSPFAPLLERIVDLGVDTLAMPGATGARYRYRLRFDSIGPSDEALSWVLITRIREILDAWSSGAATAVDLEVEVEGEVQAAPPVSAHASKHES